MVVPVGAMWVMWVGVSGRVVAGSGGLVGRAVGSELNDAVVVRWCGGWAPVGVMCVTWVV